MKSLIILLDSRSNNSMLHHFALLGGAMFIHTFGAYFGLAVSLTHRNRQVELSGNLEESRYTSDIFSLVCITHISADVNVHILKTLCTYILLCCTCHILNYLKFRLELSFCGSIGQASMLC